MYELMNTLLKKLNKIKYIYELYENKEIDDIEILSQCKDQLIRCINIAETIDNDNLVQLCNDLMHEFLINTNYYEGHQKIEMLLKSQFIELLTEMIKNCQELK